MSRRKADERSGCGGGAGAFSGDGSVRYGGQAVIEGVMMRGPTRVATAVRAPGGSIVVDEKEYLPVSRRYRLLRLPVIRGGITLIESLVLGVKALNYSAAAAMEEPSTGADSEGGPSARSAVESGDEPAGAEAGSEDRPGLKANVMLTGTVVFAFALGIAFFFYIPLVLTDWLTRSMGSESGVLFNLIDGVIRVIFFLIYLWAISQWKEMRRVFEYHGAEHKTIFTLEAGEELRPENARKHTTRHPRCGTSFLLIVMVVSILIFMIFGRPQNVTHRLLRLLLIPVIAGASYEVLKLSAKWAHRPWARWLVAPGVWLQRITTKEPSDDQIEVAIAALNAVRIDTDHVREAPGDS